MRPTRRLLSIVLAAALPSAIAHPTTVRAAATALPARAEEVRRVTIGTAAGEVATSVIALPDGDLLMAGYEYAGWNLPWSAIAVRAHADDRLMWLRAYGGPDDDILIVTLRDSAGSSPH